MFGDGYSKYYHGGAVCPTILRTLIDLVLMPLAAVGACFGMGTRGGRRGLSGRFSAGQGMMSTSAFGSMASYYGDDEMEGGLFEGPGFWLFMSTIVQLIAVCGLAYSIASMAIQLHADYNGKGNTSVLDVVHGKKVGASSVNASTRLLSFPASASGGGLRGSHLLSGLGSAEQFAGVLPGAAVVSEESTAAGKTMHRRLQEVEQMGLDGNEIVHAADLSPQPLLTESARWFLNWLSPG